MTFGVMGSDEEEQRILTMKEIRTLLTEQEERINATHKEEMRLLEEATDKRIKDLELRSLLEDERSDIRDSAGAKQHDILPLTDNESTPRIMSKRTFLLFQNTSERSIDEGECLEEDTFTLMMLNKPFHDYSHCNPVLVRICGILGILGNASLIIAPFVQLLMGTNALEIAGYKIFYWPLLALSMVMAYGALSGPWLLSMFTFLHLQMNLELNIIMDQSEISKLISCDPEEICLPFNIPLNAWIGMVLSQYLTVFFVLVTQSDLFSSVQTLDKLRNANNVPWDEVIGKRGTRTWRLWVFRILIPNILKFIQAAVIIVASFIVIIRSTRIVDLLKDFTSLLIVSEADNIMFHITEQGYFGDHLAQKAREAKCVRWISMEEERVLDDGEGKPLRRFLKRFCSMGACVFFTSCFAMFGALTYVVAGQYSGKWVKMKYPNCNVPDTRLIGSQVCTDMLPYNTAECGWDGGDCPIPAVARGYPNCAVSFPDKIGNGKCDDRPPYNTKECGYDGNDCIRKPVEGKPFCMVPDPSKIGNGFCDDYAPYNTILCGHDGGDCDSSIENHHSDQVPNNLN